MTEVVFKYSVPCMGENGVLLPAGAQVLTVAEQSNGIVFWAKVNPSNPVVERLIYCCFTGHAVPDFYNHYVATVSLVNGLVVHVFMHEAVEC